MSRNVVIGQSSPLYSKESKENRTEVVISIFAKIFTLFKSLVQRFFRYRIFKEIKHNFARKYNISYQILSDVTQIIVIDVGDEYVEQLCLKIWRPCKDRVYDTQDRTMRTNYLLDGLLFNRRFARGVYLGMAPVERQDEQTICLGQLIRNPKKSKLQSEKEYAVVMRYLPDTWQLDHQLCKDKLGTQDGVEFLAQQVAHMHRRLKRSPYVNMGKQKWLESLASKLTLNIGQLEDALGILFETHGQKYKRYNQIIEVMQQACKAFQIRFEARSTHIKRCHGDLKATNLWVRPEEQVWFGLKKPLHLLALDCIDFNHPEFCHIDTLSDIAMLAVDIEMHLVDKLGKQEGRRLTRHFLDTYISKAKEKPEEVWPLLEYYMAEKAMVCACTSLVYDHCTAAFVERYLEISLAYVQRLKRRIQYPKKSASAKKQSKVLVASYSR